MKEVIEKLVEIENEAQGIVDNASNEKTRIARDQRIKLEEYRAELEQDNRQKLDDLRNQIQGETNPESTRVYGEANEKLSKIENDFRENKDKMAEEVVQRIIGA